MKFFKSRKESSSNVLSDEKTQEITLKFCLDYFSTFGKVGQNIIANQRFVIGQLSQENLSEFTNAQIDSQLNRQLIKERATTKYKVTDEDFTLTHTEWFPRLRTIRFNDEEDTQSISSYNSDFQDGFAGPFTWETRSLQGMVFPPTPANERKQIKNNEKNNKKKKNKRTSTSDENNNNSHRTYETIEEIKVRLMKNYKEAKEQREKYLNLKSEKSREEIEEKSVNGFRDRNNKYKNNKILTYTNRRNAEDTQKPSKTVIKFSKELSTSKMSTSNSFASELSNAIMKHSASGSSLKTSGTPTSTSSYSVQSMASNKSDANIPNRENVTVTDFNTNDGINTEKELTRKNSLKNRKRSDSKSSTRSSLKRKISLKKSSSQKTRPSSSTSTKKNDGEEEVFTNQNGALADHDLSNVMDMLANW